MTTTTQTPTARPMSDRTVRRDYSAACRAVRTLTATQEAGVREGYEEVVHNALMEQTAIMTTLGRHAAVMNLADADRRKLER